MKHLYLAAAAALSFVATAASAQTVYNTSLQSINQPVGLNGQATTTTNATGTRTTVTGSGPNDNANRAHGAPVAGQWFQDNVGYGSTVGITTDFARSGNGSAYFNQTVANNGKADLQYYFGGTSALSSLSSFSYDYFRSGTSTNDPIQAPVLRLDVFKGTTFAGALIYEPIYNTGANAIVNSWATMSGDLNNGIWWSNNALLGGTPQTVFQTLQAWIDANPGLNVFGLETGFGSGWQGMFTGAVDNVNVNFAGRSVSSNFEVAAATPSVPEPATWGLMLVGFGAMGLGLRRRTRATLRTA